MRAHTFVLPTFLVASTGCGLLLGLEDDYRDDRVPDAGMADTQAVDAPSGTDSAMPPEDATTMVDSSDAADGGGTDAESDTGVDGGVATSIANVTGLAAWFSGDVGVATNGSVVTSWTSHGGAAVIAKPIAGAAAPTVVAQGINGAPAVHLDGTPGNAACPCPGFGGSLAASLVQPLTVVAVVKNTRWTDFSHNYRGILLASALPPPQYMKLHGHIVTGPAPTWALSGTAMIATNPFDDPGFRAAHVVVAKLDRASSLVRIDGVERATGNIGSAPWGTGFTIGNEGSALSSFQGDIAELAIFGRGLDGTEMDAVEGAFKAKYATP